MTRAVLTSADKTSVAPHDEQNETRRPGCGPIRFNGSHNGVQGARCRSPSYTNFVGLVGFEDIDKWSPLFRPEINDSFLLWTKDGDRMWRMRGENDQLQHVFTVACFYTKQT